MVARGTPVVREAAHTEAPVERTSSTASRSFPTSTGRRRRTPAFLAMANTVRRSTLYSAAAAHTEIFGLDEVANLQRVRRAAAQVAQVLVGNRAILRL